MEKVDQLSIKRSNLLRVWRALQDRPSVTRHELARETGLSLMSITLIVNLLVDHHAVSVSAPQAGTSAKRTAGRRAESVAIDKYSLVWLLIDLTSRSFSLCALTMNRQPLYLTPPWTFEKTRSYEENIDLFLRRVRKYVDNELKGHEMMGVGVVVPGAYDEAEDRVHSERLPEIGEVRLRETLRYELGLYEYFVDEDARFAARAYAAQDADDPYFYLLLGEGAAGAICRGDGTPLSRGGTACGVGRLLLSDGGRCADVLCARSFARALGVRGVAALPDEAVQREIENALLNPSERLEDALLDFARRTAELLCTVSGVLTPTRIVLDCRYARRDSGYFPRVSEAFRDALHGDAAPVLLPPMPDGLDIVAGVFRALSEAWIYRIA